MAVPFHASAQGVRASHDVWPIIEILVVGNEKTDKKILLQEMTIGVGDLPTVKAIEKSEQAIRDLGLFKSVKIRTDKLAAGTRLVIEVKEKYYLLPLPRFRRNADGDIKYGLQMRHSNLGGTNQSLKVTAERTEHKDDVLSDKETFRIEYAYPRFSLSVYDLEFKYEYDQSEEEHVDDATGDISLYDQDEYSARIKLSRWYSDTGASRGFRVGAGLAVADTEYTYISGTPGVFDNSHFVSVLGEIGYFDVHETGFSRYGRAYGYNIGYAWDKLGSDYDVATHELFYREYRPVSDTPHRTVNSQFRFGFSNAEGNEAFDIGDSSNLRGYSRKEVIGNAYVILNTQYLAPWPGYPAFRYVVFADIGNAYKNVRYVRLDDMKYSAGVGFRWKIRSFVNTDLRLDWAYAYETGESKVYGSTNVMF